MSCNHETKEGVDTSQTPQRPREMVQKQAGNGPGRKTNCKQAVLSAGNGENDNSTTAGPISTIEVGTSRG